MILCGNIGLAALLTGDTDAARAAFREELELCRRARRPADRRRRSPRAGGRRRRRCRPEPCRAAARRRGGARLRTARRRRGAARGDVLRDRPHTARCRRLGRRGPGRGSAELRGRDRLRLESAPSARGNVMEFGILGPLEVRADGRVVELGGVKPRAVLAVLALHANQPVSAERLAVALWGEDVAAERGQDGPGLRRTPAQGARRSDLLATTPAGYRLRVRPGELDAERFERLVVTARESAGGRARATRLQPRSARGAGALARPAARRPRLDAVRPGGDRSPRGAAPRGAGAARRGRPRGRAPCRARRPSSSS